MTLHIDRSYVEFYGKRLAVMAALVPYVIKLKGSGRVFFASDSVQVVLL